MTPPPKLRRRTSDDTYRVGCGTANIAALADDRSGNTRIGIDRVSGPDNGVGDVGAFVDLTIFPDHTIFDPDAAANGYVRSNNRLFINKNVCPQTRSVQRACRN